MAKNEKSADTLQASAASSGDAVQRFEFELLTQYVKDLSFENPGLPRRANNTVEPQIDLRIDINAEKIADDAYEVVLRVHANAKQQDAPVFALDLSYAGVFGLRSINPEILRPVLLIECPKFLFPFARQIVAQTTANGSYMPMMLQPIDFMALYQQNLERVETVGVA